MNPKDFKGYLIWKKDQQFNDVIFLFPRWLHKKIGKTIYIFILLDLTH
jgi:hypothetical protein